MTSPRQAHGAIASCAAISTSSCSRRCKKSRRDGTSPSTSCRRTSGATWTACRSWPAPTPSVYRTRKFVRRHWLGLAAVASLVVALAGGAAVSLYQARIAETRFQQVRKLANRFLFDFYDQIRNLPGSTAAREMVVATALEYLDSLSKDARNDPDLQWELAKAYERVGEVQGDPGGPSLGQTKAAHESYKKSAAMQQELVDRGFADTSRRAVAVAGLRACDDDGSTRRHARGSAAGRRASGRARSSRVRGVRRRGEGLVDDGAARPGRAAEVDGNRAGGRVGAASPIASRCLVDTRTADLGEGLSEHRPFGSSRGALRGGGRRLSAGHPLARTAARRARPRYDERPRSGAGVSRRRRRVGRRRSLQPRAAAGSGSLLSKGARSRRAARRDRFEERHRPNGAGAIDRQMVGGRRSDQPGRGAATVSSRARSGRVGAAGRAGSPGLAWLRLQFDRIGCRAARPASRGAREPRAVAGDLGRPPRGSPQFSGRSQRHRRHRYRVCGSRSRRSACRHSALSPVARGRRPGCRPPSEGLRGGLSSGRRARRAHQAAGKNGSSRRSQRASGNGSSSCGRNGTASSRGRRSSSVDSRRLRRPSAVDAARQA